MRTLYFAAVVSIFFFVTFRVSRRPREMYCGHARLCVCMSVCLSAAACPRYCRDPDVTWGSGRGCPLVVHCWADLQSVHGLRLATVEMQSPAVIRQAHRTPHACRTRTLRMPAKTHHRQQHGRACCVRRSILSILRGCCNASAKC